MRYVAEHPELETRAVTLHARPPPAAPSAGSPPPAPPAGLPARLTPLQRNADPPQRSQTADKQATACLPGGKCDNLRSWTVRGTPAFGAGCLLLAIRHGAMA